MKFNLSSSFISALFFIPISSANTSRADSELAAVEETAARGFVEICKSTQVGTDTMHTLEVLTKLTNLSSAPLTAESTAAALEAIKCDELYKRLRNLKRVELRNQSLVDIGPLSGLTSVEELDLADNKITSLRGLETLKNLRAVDLKRNQIADIKLLEKLQRLQSLSIEGNHISDVSPLVKITKLTWLYIAENQVKNLEEIGKIRALRELHVRKNQLVDISGIRNLPNLESVDLQDNLLTDVSSLAALQKVTFINLSGNKISKIPEFKQGKLLETLILDHNEISDLSPLGVISNSSLNTTPQVALEKLKTLILGNNPIQNADILATLPNIIYLDLKGTPLAERHECPLPFSGYCQF